MARINNRTELKHFRQALRSNMTKSETVLWKNIKGKQIGWKFRRQFSISSNYILDFYCPELKLAVEVDGFTHADEKVFERDQKKDAFLESQNIIVKRHNSEQVLKKIKDVLFDLYHTCEGIRNHTAPTPPLNLPLGQGETARRFVLNQLLTS